MCVCVCVSSSGPSVSGVCVVIFVRAGESRQEGRYAWGRAHRVTAAWRNQQKFQHIMNFSIIQSNTLGLDFNSEHSCLQSISLLTPKP